MFVEHKRGRTCLAAPAARTSRLTNSFIKNSHHFFIFFIYIYVFNKNKKYNSKAGVMKHSDAVPIAQEKKS